MEKTKIKIVRNHLGARDVIVTNDDLTQEQKNLIKYEVYKQINESYHNLMKSLQTNGEA